MNSWKQRTPTILVSIPTMVMSLSSNPRGAGPPPHPWASRVASPPHPKASPRPGAPHPKSSPFKNKCVACARFCNKRRNFFTDEEIVDERRTFSQKPFSAFDIHELCDKKQGIKLTSLLNHNVPRTDCRFMAKALIMFSTNGGGCPGVGGGRGPHLVITEVRSTPPLGTSVMPRGLEVGTYPWDCLRGMLAIQVEWVAVGKNRQFNTAPHWWHVSLLVTTRTAHAVCRRCTRSKLLLLGGAHTPTLVIAVAANPDMP